MNDLLITALWLSLSGSLFILALCFCKPMFRHKLSKGWQYYIWLVVIARLLLPFSSEVNLLGNVYERIEGAVTTSTLKQETLNEPIPDITTPDTDYNNILPPTLNSNDQTDSSIVPETQTTSLAEQFGKALSIVLSNAWLVWIMVAVILLIRKITIYQSFIRYIKAGRIEVSDIEHLELLGKIAEQLKIKRTVGLYTNGLISSPILIGFFKPCIILPTTELADADFRNTILHELMHYKRLDMFYKWLVQLTICLHWFNPLVYLMGREINRACELSCDEASIRTLNPKEQRAYGDTLLNVLAMGKYNQQLASLSLNEGKELMKERLDSIMNFKNKSVFVRCSALMLTLVFMCGFAVTGVVAINGNQGIPKPPLPSAYNNGKITQSFDEWENNWASQWANDVANNAKSEITTAKANSYEVIKNPNININIQSAGVRIQSAKDNQVTVEYDKNIYKATVENVNGNWAVNVSGKLQNNRNPQMVTIYLPDIIYGNVDLDISTAYAKIQLKGGNIKISTNMADVNLELLKDFSGSVSAMVGGGNLELISADNFKNSTVTVTNKADKAMGQPMGTVLVPSDFIANGDINTYTNGTKANRIEVTLNKFGEVRLDNQKQTYISRTDSLKQNFERYKAFGVIYNAEQNAVYYNGKRVKLFVEFKSSKEEGMTYAFDLCYEDTKTDSTLYLEAVKDSSGKITAIRPLKPQIVNELLMVNLSENDTQNTYESITENEEVFVYTMDATQVFKDYGITAKDLTKSKVGEPIKNWINQCDKNKGAYVLTTESGNQYTTYIYYNGGGRYPWNMRVDDNKITIDLYSNNKLATKDGYYLMYFTAPKNYSDISLFLDNAQLYFVDYNKKTATPWLNMGIGDGQPYV